MINPLEGKQFKTFDELLESDKSLIVTKMMLNSLKNNQKFQKLFENNRILTEFPTSNTHDEKLAIWQPCDGVDLGLSLGDDFIDGYYRNKYKIHQPFSLYFIQLEAGRVNPYLDKFQHLMDLSTEAGLPKAWKMFFEHDVANHQNRSRRENYEADFESLNFSHIIPMFLILAFGFVLAFFVFLIEIFYCDFIAKMFNDLWIAKFREMLSWKRNL